MQQFHYSFAGMLPDWARGLAGLVSGSALMIFTVPLSALFYIGVVLTALFALFLARPHPFYLLDEVEAALDDTNIGRFVDLLRSYATKAQFIVITHQKRTMQAADILYGVTMGANGVSQVVSRRMPADAGTSTVAPA